MVCFFSDLDIWNDNSVCRVFFRDLTWLWQGLKLCSSWWETPSFYGQMQTGAGMAAYHLNAHEMHKSWCCFALMLTQCCLHLFRFIDFCTEQGGYTGYQFSNVERIEEVEERLLALNIQETGGKTWLLLISAKWILNNLCCLHALKCTFTSNPSSFFRCFFTFNIEQIRNNTKMHTE